MRRLIAIAMLLVLVSAADHLPSPDDVSVFLDGYLDRNILCRYISSRRGDTHPLQMSMDDDPICPGALAGPLPSLDQNNCDGKCEPVAIADQLVDAAKESVVTITEKIKSIFAFA